MLISCFSRKFPAAPPPPPAGDPGSVLQVLRELDGFSNENLQQVETSFMNLESQLQSKEEMESICGLGDSLQRQLITPITYLSQTNAILAEKLFFLHLLT